MPRRGPPRGRRHHRLLVGRAGLHGGHLHRGHGPLLAGPLARARGAPSRAAQVDRQGARDRPHGRLVRFAPRDARDRQLALHSRQPCADLRDRGNPASRPAAAFDAALHRGARVDAGADAARQHARAALHGAVPALQAVCGLDRARALRPHLDRHPLGHPRHDLARPSRDRHEGARAHAALPLAGLAALPAGPPGHRAPEPAPSPPHRFRFGQSRPRPHRRLHR